MFLWLTREANIWAASSVDLGGHICQNLKTLCRKCLSKLQQRQLLLVQLTRWWNSPSFTSAFANAYANWCQKPLPFNSKEWSGRTTGNLFFPLRCCTGWCYILPLCLSHPWDHVSCLKGVLIASTLAIRYVLFRAVWIRYAPALQKTVPTQFTDAESRAPRCAHHLLGLL